MTIALLRDSIDLLLQEAYDGPADPQHTWFVTNTADSGVLGTIRHLTADQAWYRPPGIAHSVAEHVEHILFSLNLAAKQAATGKTIDADWDESWNCGEPSEGHWQAMQRHLRESHLRLRMWVHSDATFASPDSISLLLATIAHAAYHLGAMRQVAAIAIREAPAEDPCAIAARPL